jgi:protease-4
VNSPGGSYVASDTIWREVCNASRAGKPVIASMGDVAGSGGYFVAMASQVIVAQPATLTGSIGVFGGKMQTKGLLEHLGVNIENIGLGRHALMFSPDTGFDHDEWAKLNEWLDLVYEDFTNKVATSRSLTPEAVHEVARGRVWTGADALERGLVDEIGGLRRAVEIARQHASLPNDAPLRPVLAISPLQRLRQPRNSDDPRAFAQSRTWGGELWEWGNHARLAQALGLPPAGPLTMSIADPLV